MPLSRGKLLTIGLAVLVLAGAALLFRSRQTSPPPAPEPVWGASYFPNIPLTAHDGRKVRFFDDLIKDKVVMINFIYTRCPDACPLETARLRQVQKLLGDRVGKDVFMYSITIDPENDTQEVLRAYAEKFKIGPGWLFLRGKDEDVTLLRKKLGMFDEGKKADNFKDHNISLIIGNQKTGQWVKSSPFENSHVLATKVGSWLHNWTLPRKEQRDYAQAPEVRNISRGESIWRTRCAACHTIGGGDVTGSETGEIGPDLLNVTRTRERTWLTRWLAEPDQMLAEGDPLALALLAQWNNVAMPNLRLNQLEIEALIAYIEEETQQVDPSGQARPEDRPR
jgi:protein SCO1/2